MPKLIRLDKHRYCNCYMCKEVVDERTTVIRMYSYGKHFITLTQRGCYRPMWTIELVQDSPSQTTSKHITWFLYEYCPDISRKQLIKFAGKGPQLIMEVERA